MSGVLSPLLVLELGSRIHSSRIHNRKEREYSAPAVDRALDILEFMAKHPRAYGTTELARCLKIPVNSVFRILRGQMLVLDTVSPEVSFYLRA